MFPMIPVSFRASVGSQSIIHLVKEIELEDANPMLGISITTFILYTILALCKFKIAKELRSEALKKDGITSSAVSCISVGIIISSAVHIHADGEGMLYFLRLILEYRGVVCRFSCCIACEYIFSCVWDLDALEIARALVVEEGILAGS